MPPQDRGAKDKAGSSQPASSQAPAITLPKGGGAIRGMGEKFAANPMTGTGSMTVPIATSPGRSGFGPQLSLAYDSGSGNGPFGFGWSLSIPSITRKTDKGLPQYRDAEESDVYILSGAEDLVPVLQPDGSRFEDDTTAPGYTIHRYRPRIEGLFARIERWTNDATGEIHWRSISRDNIITLYGQDNNSRIYDPADPDPEHPTRIFSWLICQSYDDKGNAIVYEYAEENSDRIFEDDQGNQVTLVHERNRTDDTRKANRYLKRIKYGNRQSTRDPDTGQRPPQLTDQQIDKAGWMFEVVFDYGNGHYSEEKPNAEGRIFADARIEPPTGSQWPARQDPFSSYRAGFEVRTYRLCQRVLMFHHFPNELETPDYLVRATEFSYQQSPIASFITGVTQSGYVRQPDQASSRKPYLKKSLPPLEFEYSQVPDAAQLAQQSIREVGAESLENLPIGLDGSIYQWIDLDGEGLSGILTQQAQAWFYKRNLSPLPPQGEDGEEAIVARFGPLERVVQQPSSADIGGGRQQFLDLAGDGQLDLVEFGGPTPGFFERSQDQGWEGFRAFVSLPDIAWDDPNLKFVDLTGDGHADILITEQEVFTWHLSLAEAGFGPTRRVHKALDETTGPRLVFADGTQSVYLADLSGDGLVDLARVRNGEVCYWPNLGYGHFGAQVTMDDAPWFDSPDLFDQRRVRLADIDGSGTTDILYLAPDGVRIYSNQSGNRWSGPQLLGQFPPTDNLSSVMAVDLLGNGTACLVWSSPLPSANGKPLRYIDLMGGQKPHLLVKTVNNLGAETQVRYAPSTKFYLADKEAGTPWITRIPFPVHVVERVETYDHISRNRFVTRYAYHHGYFDGVEREFRGFGLVEQWDTEEYATLAADGLLKDADNLDKASHVPPVLTKTWFHTGAYLDRAHISRQFEAEYYREPDLSDPEFRALLLPDTLLPDGLTVEEEREACRALKGSMLRQEVYADDAPPGASEAMIRRARTPYIVTEQNFTIKRLQAQGDNRHGVFFTHPREAISYHYERHLVPILNGQVVDEATAATDQNTQCRPDPRIQHALTLEVDKFGNVLRSIAVGYPRAEVPERPEQNETHLTLTLNRFANREQGDWRHIGLPVETRTYEVVKPPAASTRFAWEELRDLVRALVPPDQVEPRPEKTIPYQEWDWRKEWEPHTEPGGLSNTRLRLIEHVRTLYRPDDLGESPDNDPLTLLELGEVESLALPGENYKLAFTADLLASIYKRGADDLLTDRDNVLKAEGGYVLGDDYRAQGLFPDDDPNGQWWIPSGRTFYSPKKGDTAKQERGFARDHFFIPHRYQDPFGQTTVVAYDDYDLLLLETRDPLENRITAGERASNPTQPPEKKGLDYRVLQPRLVMGPNRNRTEVVFDALGLVVGTAVMGKPEDNQPQGDSLDTSFVADLPGADIDAFFDAGDPHVPAKNHLKTATTCIVYDIRRFFETRQSYPQEPEKWEPAFAATLSRETHVSDLGRGEETKIQISFSYSDGFGREIQKKIQAERGPVPKRDSEGKIIVGPDHQPEMTANDVSPRWVGSGWTVFNNKGRPVRQFEPFFTDTHRFEFDVRIGVSPVLFYDPLERVVATLHPNHTYEKVVFDPWQQTTYDVNDTVAASGAQTGDPRTDPDITGYVYEYFNTQSHGWETWHAQRINGSLGPQEQDAANKAAAHADTPTTAYLDTLGRPFLTVAHNKVDCPKHPLDGKEDKFHTHVELDIEGNQREVRDERKLPVNYLPTGALEQRIVMRYAYDMLGNCIHQFSMEAGARWMLNDVVGNPIRAWDSRGHNFKTEYDQLRRPVRQFVRGTDDNHSDLRTLNGEILFEQIEYGEGQGNDIALNLRTRLFKQYDAAGVITSEEYDFKGNLLCSTRELAQEYKDVIDWAHPPQTPGETFLSSTTYDALNRPVQMIAPYSDQPGTKINVIQPGYNEANLLEQVNAWLNQSAKPSDLLDPDTANLKAVTDIDYDAKGQRTLIDYGNGVRTTYTYDPLTFRLVHLLTRRDATSFPGDCPQPPPPDWPGCQVQNLHYTYDPVGNITHIRDDAQQRIYFNNIRVEPSADYTYDALYRLVEATGREHLGQNRAQIPHSYNDARRIGLRHPDAGNAMGRYCEKYVYDAVGNILQMSHHVSCHDSASWTRTYTYEEASQIEQAKQSNRLTSTSIGGTPETYSTSGGGYDPHGNMLKMPQLQIMQWDYQDQLQMTQRQKVNNQDKEGEERNGERTYYVYDASGQRVRKVTERHAPPGHSPTRREERIYLGGFEIYRKYNGGNGALELERETLHIMDSPSRPGGGNQQRIALVETRTQGDDDSPPQLIRYQFGNHLGSASLELDDRAQIISYEEYTPYGSTSYQAVDKTLKAAAKRYRYTGKERDEESGLYYHGLRYYTPCLGRWTNCDPFGIKDGVNVYSFVHDRPINEIDLTGADGEGADRQPWWRFTEAGFQYQTGRHDIFSTHPGYDTGFAPANFVVNFIVSAGNLCTIPFNTLTEAAAIPEEIARFAGASEEDIAAMNFALMMTGVGEVNYLTNMVRSVSTVKKFKQTTKIVKDVKQIAKIVKKVDQTVQKVKKVDKTTKGVSKVPQSWSDEIAELTSKTSKGASQSPTKLKFLHPESSMSRSNLNFWSKQSTEAIVESLKPSAESPLRLKGNLIMQGNTRMHVLLKRGFNIDTLPSAW